MPVTSLRKVDIDTGERLLALLGSSEIRVRNEFLRAIQNVKSQTTLDEITRLLEQGLIDQAIALTASIPLIVSNAVNNTVVRTGDSTAKEISTTTELIVTFDQTNNRAVNLMRNNRLRLVREFTAGQREATRSALIQGVQGGLNPRQVAKEFRNSIGLTERQVSAVNNYRRLLESNSSESLNRRLRDRRFDRTVQRAIDSNEPLTNTQVNRMVDRYRQRFIKHRSEVIARTESLTAVHEANEAMYQQAFDEEALDPATITREWITAGDDRVRDSHEGMDGQRRKEGEPFITSFGNQLQFPGDRNAPASETIQCRCVVSRIIS